MERSSYAQHRVERLLRLLDPRLSNQEQLDVLSQFVEQETADAYRRGLRGRGSFRSRTVERETRDEARDRSRMTRAGKPLNYSSAVQAGVLPRIEHEDEEGGQ